MISVNKTRRVLLITNDAIGQNMAGPGIRYWEFARVLSEYFNVTLAIPPFIKQGTIPAPPFAAKIVHCRQEIELQTLAAQADVIVTVGTVLSVYPTLSKSGTPLVLDAYIPFLIENLKLYSTGSTASDTFAYERERNAHNTQLRIADFIICASEKQRDYWLGLLTALGRVNPYTYNDDPTLRRLIDVVPFGLPKEKPVHSKQVLKGVYKNIKPDDYVLIWTGGLWKWFDAPTLIKAMPLLLQRQPNVKLFFMGVLRPHNSDLTKVDTTAIELSKELGLYDTHIFFNDWVPYHERQNYLLEADLGVSLHSNYIETNFAFRTRFLDHLWAGLPSLTTEGDVMSDELVRLKLGCTVRAGDVTGVANKILKMLTAKEIGHRDQINLENVISKYQWETVTRPLIEFCANPFLAPDKGYLQTIPIIEIGPTPYWKLPQKAWHALKNSGFSGLLTQLKQYIVWKQHS